MNWRTVRVSLKDLALQSKSVLLVDDSGRAGILRRRVLRTASYCRREVESGDVCAGHPPAFQQLTRQAGTDIKIVDTEDALKQAVLKGNHQAGVALQPMS